MRISKAVPPVDIVSSMPDAPTTLKHTYFLLRHGQSTANLDEIIASKRDLAYSHQAGLTELGYQQGFDAASQLKKLLGDDSIELIFVTSPFARARETAQACIDGMQQEYPLYYHDMLVERDFGKLDRQDIDTYAYVWPLDRMNATHTTFDVESVAAVCHRWQALFQDLEKCFVEPSNIVCVSHADVLQIGQLFAADAERIGEFSSFRFVNGEVRQLHLGTTEFLPPAEPLPAPQRDLAQIMVSKQRTV